MTGHAHQGGTTNRPMEDRQMDERLLKIITSIANVHLGIPTLETRKSGDLDFHEVSVWSLKDALGAAYQAGRNAPKAKPKIKTGV